MKKIIVTVREFTSYTGMDVDSRLFDGDTLEPITMVEEDGRVFHLGQVSSSIHWAVQDIPDPTRTAKQELDRRYPDGYEFVYYFLHEHFCYDKALFWWQHLSEPDRKEAIIKFSNLHIELTDEQKDKIRNGANLPKIPNKFRFDSWVNSQMIHEAVKLKPIDPNNIIIEPYIKTPRVKKVWEVAIKINHGGMSREFNYEPTEEDVQEMVELIQEERQCYITAINVTTKFKLT